jgi:hypothetical protein
MQGNKGLASPSPAVNSSVDSSRATVAGRSRSGRGPSSGRGESDLGHQVDGDSPAVVGDDGASQWKGQTGEGGDGWSPK